MESNIVLSVIIPVYNTASFLRDCIISLEQIDEILEVICINDGSTDNSLEVLQDISNEYNNILIINQVNQGVSAAEIEELRLQEANIFGFLIVMICAYHLQ